MTIAQTLVLKEDEVFIVSDDAGNVTRETAEGLYYHDTRYLSLFNLKVNGQELELLNSSGEQNFMANLEFANLYFTLADGTRVRTQTIKFERNRFIMDGMYEHLKITNFNRFSVPLTISLTLSADFRDMFDIRGFPRAQYGVIQTPEWNGKQLAFRYRGADNVETSCQVSFDREPDNVDISLPEQQVSAAVESGTIAPNLVNPAEQVVINAPTVTLTWNIEAAPQVEIGLGMRVYPDELKARSSNASYDNMVDELNRRYQQWDEQSSQISCNEELFNRLLGRSSQDLRMLMELQPDGSYFPDAGIPWFACPFGRDSLFTAYQTLMLNPGIAVGTLRYLAKHQGSEVNDWRDEQPGKIVHEMRFGEMARLNLVPHGAYYGSVDSTPLFLMLFVETMRWLDDDKLYDELLPHIDRALEWIDKYGDLDGDGFVEYQQRSERGIRNQVWKDSEDSTEFPDGAFAEPPVAAVEVQGYVYAAKQGLAALFARKGRAEQAARLQQQADEMKRHFNAAFWMPDLGFYAQALDRDKQPVPTISSNPGHCLFAGIIDADKAEQVVRRLMQPDMASGWGIRTISSSDPNYNPMSYHNGSIWPHDNSLIVAGMKRYGFHDEANAIVSQMFEAAMRFRYYRLPELFCGFSREGRYHSRPSEYPVSCSPLAWAAGATLLFTQSIIGLQPDAHAGKLTLSPHLPTWLNTLRVCNLRIGERRIDLLINRAEGHDKVEIGGRSRGIAIELA
jgi:glycogen debranching enzyme